MKRLNAPLPGNVFWLVIVMLPAKTLAALLYQERDQSESRYGISAPLPEQIISSETDKHR